MAKPTPAPHEAAKYWTPDEVAEALDGISDATSSRLWALMNQMKEHAPLGGDGSNGTVEWPEPIEEGHSVRAIWHLLTEDERREINAAFEAQESAFSGAGPRDGEIETWEEEDDD